MSTLETFLVNNLEQQDIGIAQQIAKDVSNGVNTIKKLIVINGTQQSGGLTFAQGLAECVEGVEVSICGIYGYSDMFDYNNPPNALILTEFDYYKDSGKQKSSATKRLRAAIEASLGFGELSFKCSKECKTIFEKFKNKPIIMHFDDRLRGKVTLESMLKKFNINEYPIQVLNFLDVPGGGHSTRAGEVFKDFKEEFNEWVQ